MKRIISEIDRRITFTFDGLDPITFDASRVNSCHHATAEMHGWNARLGDTAATEKTETGRRTAVAALIEHYHSGNANWSMRARSVVQENAAIRKLADAKFNGDYAQAEAHVANLAIAELMG